ncbi:response regulator transcription factor [Lentzea rhizosphaerae]|uniref:Response regulator transcription factor n=1 Tax=Lentzea rhizosphaerae TaxID=2041025 RepID=A0ABV8BXM7_9PSEU
MRREFRSAVAELHALAGWAAFDAGLGGSAHHHFHLALDFAQDDDLVANTRHTKAILAANRAWCYAELGLRLLFGIADEVQVRPGRPTWPGTVVRALVRIWSTVPDVLAPSGRPRVLLVDGDRFSGQSLAAFLRAEGYDATLVTTVAAAESALESPPALAVLDLLTSRGEGTRFAAEARTFGVPVVAVSAIEPAADVADAYLPKPAHPLRVLAAVRDLLSPDS